MDGPFAGAPTTAEDGGPPPHWAGSSVSLQAYFLAEPVVFGLGAFLEMVGILEGLAPPPGRLGVSDVSEQTERASWSSDASEASLPRRLLALLPARLPARLVGPLAVDAPRFGSVRDGLLVCGVPPFSPVSEPRLEWNGGRFSLDPDGAPSCPGVLWL